MRVDASLSAAPDWSDFGDMLIAGQDDHPRRDLQMLGPPLPEKDRERVIEMPTAILSLTFSIPRGAFP